MTLADGRSARAKCAVVSTQAFVRETSHRRRDHFFLGRLFQQTEIVIAGRGRAARAGRWTRSPARTRSRTTGCGPGCRSASTSPSTAARCCACPTAAEIRPEPERRARALWEAQQDYLRPVYGVLLRELRADGRRCWSPSRASSRWPGRPAACERLRLSAYFAGSMVRATVRWAKYVVTFDDWLEFILRKARRHSGQDDRAHAARATPAAAVPVAARLPLPAAQGPLMRRYRAGVRDRPGRRGCRLDGRLRRSRAAGRTPTPRARARSSRWARATSSSTGSCGCSARWTGSAPARWAGRPTSSTSPGSCCGAVERAC